MNSRLLISLYIPLLFTLKFIPRTRLAYSSDSFIAAVSGGTSCVPFAGERGLALEAKILEQPL